MQFKILQYLLYLLFVCISFEGKGNVVDITQAVFSKGQGPFKVCLPSIHVIFVEQLEILKVQNFKSSKSSQTTHLKLHMVQSMTIIAYIFAIAYLQLFKILSFKQIYCKTYVNAIDK